VCGQTTLLELTASRQPSESKGSDGESWRGRSRGGRPQRGPGELYRLIRVCPALGSLTVVNSVPGVSRVPSAITLRVCALCLACRCLSLEDFQVRFCFPPRVCCA